MMRLASGRVLGLEQSFSNDTLGYFVERLDPAISRSALITVVGHAKRGKASKIVVLLDWLWVESERVGAGNPRCVWCRPIHDAKHNVIGYHHQPATISVVGTGLTCPSMSNPMVRETAS